MKILICLCLMMSVIAAENSKEKAQAQAKAQSARSLKFLQEAQSFLTPVKKAFMAEMQQGLKKGPYNAVDVCHLKAPHLSEGKKADKFDFGRTSHKIRNEKNAATDKWLVKAIDDYKSSSAKKPRFPQVYAVDTDKYAYVEPIYIKPVCLQCHGELKGSVKKRISSLYPKDQATGFKLGEFRGLFWIKQK